MAAPDAARAMRHGVVLLAAGASTRLGRSKQLIERDGETLVHRAARLALATQPDDAVVVLGANAASVADALHDLPMRTVHCAAFERGMGTSLHAGLDALPARCASALVVLCDQPALTEAHLAALCAAWASQPARAVASAYAGRLGAPALLPRAWFALLDDTGDDGARRLFAAHRDEVIAIANEALAVDIDTPKDLDCWIAAR